VSAPARVWYSYVSKYVLRLLLVSESSVAHRLSRVLLEHDFFTPQPVKHAAVYLLRVVLHDWPNAFAQRILLRLREAASEDTKLLIADFVLPLACADDFSVSDELEEVGLENIQGAEKILAPSPLLPNLGKASANAYWMDLTVRDNDILVPPNNNFLDRCK
jgi:hypothetical protein